MKSKLLRTLLLFLFIVAFFLTIVYSIEKGWYSFLILWALSIIVFGFFLSFRYKSETRNLFFLFLFPFCFYSIYMFITNYLYVDNPSTDFFMIVDSMKFWNNSNFSMHSLHDVNERFREMAFETAKYRLFNLQSLLLSYFCQLIDENNILVQKLPSLFLGAASIPYIYLMLKKYITPHKAFNYSLFFSIFSFVCIYSTVFNRDPQVYFLFTLGAYLLVYYQEKKWVLFKLFALMVITLGFRLEHGLFFSLYLMIYLYLVSSRSVALKVMLFISISFISIFAFPYIATKFNSTSEAYEAKRENVERKEVSFGATFANLPPGIKQALLMVNSQIAPAVPFWRGWYQEDVNRTVIRFRQPGYHTPWRFMEGIAACVWVYIWGFVIGGVKSVLIKLPLNIRFLFLFSILLLIAATSEINVRRIYCVYPIIFLVSMLLYNNMEKKLRRIIISRVTIFICLAYILYFIVK